MFEAMSVIRIDHSFNFVANYDYRRSDNRENLKSPPKTFSGNNEIPKSTWQLTCETNRMDRTWGFNVNLPNYLDFKSGNFIALGTAYLKLDYVGKDYYPDEKSDPCQHFDLGQTQLNNLNSEKVWDFQNVDLVRGKSYYIYVNINLISNQPNSNRPSKKIKLESDFSELLENGLYADLVLVAEEKEFKVHKNIVASRSAVFGRMLEVKNENRVEISDVKSGVLEKMLMFMYTGTLEDSDVLGLLEELYSAAEKYEISDLKKFVAEKLCTGIAIENIGKRFLLADKFKEMVLRQKCLEFFRDNCAVLSKHKESLLFP